MFTESHLNLTTDGHFHVSCSISHKKEKLTIFSVCLYEQNLKTFHCHTKKPIKYHLKYKENQHFLC